MIVHVSPSSLPATHRIFLVGLKFHAEIGSARSQYGSGDKIEKDVTGEYPRLEAAGYHLTTLNVDDEFADRDIAEFESYLQTSKYDAIMLGVGLRILPEHTVIFERMINLCRTLAPETPIVFNARPGGTGEALARTFGV